MSTARTIRFPVVAGMFYPSDPAELAEEIDSLFEQAEKKSVAGRIRGIIAPHAGYIYSGLTAAHAYAMLRGESFDTVVVVSPSHREFFRGASVYSGDMYVTPLGAIEVNTALRERLLEASEHIHASEDGHRGEHALEVQLPFLQKALPSFKLLPIVAGDQTAEFCFELGVALANAVRDENVLFVASTDLSHFYSSDVAKHLDDVMIRDIEHFDYEQLMRDLESRRTEACGGGPTVAVLSALDRLGVKNIKVLHYATSGDTTGDYSSVVGYVSAVAYESPVPDVPA
ncbi:AmmeMemoRadiSam system protein B [Sphingobacteriales bacterium CHB3]|nr:AmmeMemoRadiSam system protein B [Sphingobacteriales bacterium CHB3]